MKSISTIAVLSAIQPEFESFVHFMSNVHKKKIKGMTYYFGNIGRFNIVALVTGIGQTNSAFSTSSVVHQFDPDLLIFSGISGAINRELKVGSIVVGKTVFSAESLSLKSITSENYRKCRHGILPDTKFSTPRFLQEKVKKLIKSSNQNVHFGTLVSSDFFPMPDYIPEKFCDNLVDSIDMESAAFYQVCKQMKKPCVAIRSISNYAEPKKKVRLKSDLIKLSAKNAAEFSNRLILSLE
ncbi:MAG: MTA/SAH nucleosidase [uncultured bacterium]|nr:MAG: MTA/SAH nucleosidase [uncultured bacterium]